MAYIYDVSDRYNPVLEREAGIEGDYVSSRLIGHTLYFIANKYIYGDIEQYDGTVCPRFTDSAQGAEFVEIPLEDIAYCPPIIINSYLLTAGIDTMEPKEEMNVTTILGSAGDVYVSQDNLYVTVYAGFYGIRPMILTAGDVFEPAYEEATLIYKFSLSDGNAEYVSKGQVPGSVLNQFSMDEYGTTFRVATTTGYSSNAVYVLDSNLNIRGSLEGLAPGERIYSARFIGNRAYVVTFKTVDPLFVIDLSDSTAPKVLGALKIPGYSDYLHPYDETHLIGFGKDTMTVPYKDSSGKVISETAYYLGMKISLFDVSDVENPKVVAEYKIGDRGTDSALLQDHKALLFNKDTGLLAFPVYETKLAGPVMSEYDYPNYGEFYFSGAYVLNLSIENGFTLVGTVTHFTLDETDKAGSYYGYSSSQIQRMLYIGNVLYAVSDTGVSAHNINSLQELAFIKP